VEKWDVAIVGGGIAGLSLAKFLAEKGIPFILFEEHTEFFRKPCGEGIVPKILGYDFYEMYGSKRGIEREVWETRIYTKYGSINLEMPLAISDKKTVEEELAKQARKQGEIRMGEKVEKIYDGIILPPKYKSENYCWSRWRLFSGERLYRC